MKTWKIISKAEASNKAKDGEGAPKPSEASIERAQEFLKSSRTRLPIISYVDPDVLGGVAIVVYSKSKKRGLGFLF